MNNFAFRYAIAHSATARVAGVKHHGFAIPLTNGAFEFRWNETVRLPDGSEHGVIRSSQVSQLLS